MFSGITTRQVQGRPWQQLMDERQLTVLGRSAADRKGGSTMRNRVVGLMAGLLIALLASGPSQAQTITNLFQNGGFETGALTPWGSYGSAAATVTSTVVKDCVAANVPEGPIEGTYCLDVKVSGPGVNFWDGAVSPVLVTGQGVFKQGKKYTLSLFFKSKSGTATINLKPEAGPRPVDRIWRSASHGHREVGGIPHHDARYDGGCDPGTRHLPRPFQGAGVLDR